MKSKILNIGEYELYVNMSYGFIWIMGDYDSSVDMNYGWIWNMGEY